MAAPYLTQDNIDAQAELWLAQVRRQVNMRRNLVLCPQSCAILVIDMLEYFCSPHGRAYLPSVEAILPRLSSLLEMWRSLGAPVFFTRHCHQGQEDLGMLGKFWSDYISCDEEQSQIISLLTPQPSEPVIVKTTYDSFLNTGLMQMLGERGVTQLLITGVMTNLCCETTARSAFCRGFEVYMAVDATCTSRENLHTGSLMGLASGFAVLHSTHEIGTLCKPCK